MKTLSFLQLTYISFIINLIFAFYNCFLGFNSHSWWFITLGAYYIVLSVMRIAVLKMDNSKEERFVKKFSGIMFILLSLCLIGTVILSFVTDRGIKYHEIVMITIALYTFTKVTLGIINLVNSRKNRSFVFKILRNISFADALVSVFSLQRSMLVSFEGMDENSIKLMNILTGSAVCLAVFILGLNLIGVKIMAKSKIIKTGKKIADSVVGGYEKIEKGVTDGYKKIEKGVVDGYTKIEDKFVDLYLTKDGESVEEAKKRLKNK